MDNRRLIHVVGFDYDGCLFKHDSTMTLSDRNARLLNAINKQNQHGFDTCIVFLSSNRQSYRVDAVNRHSVAMTDENNHAESSCFIPIKRLVESMENATLCPMLLADAYEERPNGYSFTRAILRGEDQTAYHPDYIFDEYKSSLIYTQAHTAARLARSCDFVCVNAASDITKLNRIPFESNAAYVYLRDTKKLYYVNRAKKQIDELPINDEREFAHFLKTMNDSIDDDDHHFEMLDENNQHLKGLTLNDTHLHLLKRMTNYRHEVKDYPIVFDFYDDLAPILHDLYNTFGAIKGSKLLPKNVIIRLHLYSGDKPKSIQPPLAIIIGTGEIDLNPKLTLVKMARILLGKQVIDECDYENSSTNKLSFATFLTDAKQANFFKARNLVEPTEKHYSDLSDHAPTHLYDSSLDPEDIIVLINSIKSLNQALNRPFTLFVESKQFELGVLRDILAYTKSHNASATSLYIKDICYQIRFCNLDLSNKTAELLLRLQTNYSQNVARISAAHPG